MKRLREFFRGFFFRKTADGKTRWDGFGFYLLVVVLMFWVAWRVARPKPASTATPFGMPPKKEATAKIETERANQSSATFTPSAPLRSSDTNPLTSSDRTSPDSPASRPPTTKAEPAPDDTGFLDTVRLASQQKSPKGGAGANTGRLPDGFIDEGDAGLRAERAQPSPSGGPAVAPGPITTGAPIVTGQPLQVQVGALDPSSMMVYRRPSAANSASAPRPSGFQTNHFLPLGFEIPAVFKDKILTLDLEGLVRLEVPTDVVFNGRVQIPRGTLLFATASKKNVADRVGFSVHTIVWRDGTQSSVAGIAKDPDGQPGVIGYYVPRPVGADAISYLGPAALGFIESQKRTSTAQQLGAGGTIQNVQQPNPYDFRNEMLSAGQSGLQEQLRRRQEELDRRYQPYVEIRAGSEAIIQLTSAADLDARGSPGAKQPVQPTQSNGPAESPAQAVQAAVKNLLGAGAPAQVPVPNEPKP